MKNKIPEIKSIEGKGKLQYLLCQKKSNRYPNSFGIFDEICEKLIRLDNFENLQAATILLIADNGIATEEISSLNQSQTNEIMELISTKKAPVCRMSRKLSLEMYPYDVGCLTEKRYDNIDVKKCIHGTKSILHFQAMEIDEVEKCIDNGLNIANEVQFINKSILCLGEIGIGNTTISTILTHYITGQNVNGLIGFGSGITNKKIINKKVIINKILTNSCYKRKEYKHNLNNIKELLSNFGSAEIATEVGVILGLASKQKIIFIDGLISTVALSIAILIDEKIEEYCYVSHLSKEPAHAVLLDFFKIKSLMHLEMYLGQASGSLILFSAFKSVYNLMIESYENEK